MTIAQTVGHITNQTVGSLIIPKIEEKSRLMISEKIQASNNLKIQSEQLLELAKTALEKAIEENEEKASNYINTTLRELKITIDHE